MTGVHMSATAVSTSFPRGALLGAAALMTLAIVAAGTARLTGIGTSHLPEAAAVESRDLRFADRADGAVVITEAETGRVVDVASPGTNGFLRSTMRGLARDRKRRDIGAETPFRLTRWADGRLSLQDQATGRNIDLGAFGPTNAAVFAHLMTVGSATP
jgi:putative photosynthetic complex assembly protein